LLTCGIGPRIRFFADDGDAVLQHKCHHSKMPCIGLIPACTDMALRLFALQLTRQGFHRHGA